MPTELDAFEIPSATWNVAPGNSEIEKNLISQFGLTPIQARLLVNRGITTPEAVKSFLKPTRAQMHPPYLFRDMEKAVARIRRAIESGEKIFIFGDRDVDGVSGTAILLTTLKAFGAVADSHIPIGNEGYGVHPDTMARAIREEFTLGIMVDTGIAEIERVAEANQGGMDVIIADHHTQKEILPAAHAILHPGVTGETYPFPYLSGAGVALKLALALFAAKSPYANRTLIFVDCETTGLDVGKHEVIEIAAIAYRNGVKQSAFSCLMKPTSVEPLEDEIKNLTGITDELLAAEGVDRKEALQGLRKFLSEPGALVLGYNVGFDKKFLDAEFKRHLNFEWNFECQDIMAAASAAIPGLASRRLTNVVKHLGIELAGAHRAMADTQAAADVFFLLLEKQDIEQNLFYERLIPLAALAAVADIMPLIGENRAIVSEGLRVMRDGPPLGLKHLLEHLKLPAPTGRDIAFLLGPLLNAPGRLGDARPALKLLTASSKKEAMQLSEDLVRLNAERKERGKENMRRLVEMVPSQNNLATDRILCIVAEGIPSGVTGICATRIREQYGRPVMIVLIEDGMGVGSGRSVESLNMMDAMDDCADLLVRFGGHHQAVGVTVRPEHIPAFFDRLKAAGAARLKQMPESVLDLDAELSVSDLTMKTIEELSVMEPFGKGNPFPKFVIYGAPLAETRRIGDDGQHLRLRIGENARNAVTAVCWSRGSDADGLGRQIDAAFEMSRNEWNGRVDVQLILDDVRPAGGRFA